LFDPEEGSSNKSRNIMNYLSVGTS
jgi:hypothetical protein